jgi:hypothetical protein
VNNLAPDLRQSQKKNQIPSEGKETFFFKKKRRKSPTRDGGRCL